jgi:4a-hydroxytetrahydrobiopterin dehydratase
MDEDLRVLTEEEINRKLKDFPGWKFHDNKISKEFKLGKFMDCLTFIMRLAPFCEAIDHHPDIHIFYSKILFDLQRFSIGGRVTERDFKVAAEIERLYNKYVSINN